MDATVTWKHGLTFTGIASSTNYAIPLGSHGAEDAPAEGASPMELILIGTAGCTAMDVISILEKKRQNVTAFEIRMHADRSESHPKVFTRITMEYVVTGRQIDREAVQRAINLSLERYCSAHAMLSKAVPIEHTATVIEAVPAGA